MHHHNSKSYNFLLVLLLGLFICAVGCSSYYPTAPSEQNTPPIEGNKNAKSNLNKISRLSDQEQVSARVITAPTNLGALVAGYLLDISMCNCTIDLAWQDNSHNETGFRIQRKRGFNGPWQGIGVVETNIESYRDSGLEPDEIYFYRVRAFDGTVRSAYSNEAMVRIGGTSPRPETLD